MMKLMHAFFALFTILLLIIRDRYVSAGVCHVKRRSINAFECSHGDTPLTSRSLPSKDCVVCARAASYGDNLCDQPKYKRDPDIHIDDEYLGIDPRD